MTVFSINPLLAKVSSFHFSTCCCVNYLNSFCHAFKDGEQHSLNWIRSIRAEPFFVVGLLVPSGVELSKLDHAALFKHLEQVIFGACEEPHLNKKAVNMSNTCCTVKYIRDIKGCKFQSLMPQALLCDY